MPAAQHAGPAAEALGDGAHAARRGCLRLKGRHAGVDHLHPGPGDRRVLPVGGIGVAGEGRHHQCALRGQHVHQGLDDRNRPAAHPAQRRLRRMHQQRHRGDDAQGAQIGRQTGAGPGLGGGLDDLLFAHRGALRWAQRTPGRARTRHPVRRAGQPRSNSRTGWRTWRAARRLAERQAFTGPSGCEGHRVPIGRRPAGRGGGRLRSEPPCL